MASFPAANPPHFGRQLLGYDRRAVDAYVAAAERARQAARDEAEQLRAAGEPLARIGGEVAGILRSLADSVAAVQDRAEAEVAQTLAAAEADAGELRRQAETDRAQAAAILDEARRQADTIVRDAETEARRLVDELVAAGTRQLEDVAGRRAAARAGLVQALETLQSALAAIDLGGADAAEERRGPERGHDPGEPASTAEEPPAPEGGTGEAAGEPERPVGVVEGTEAYEPLPCTDPASLSALAADWLREQNESSDDRWSWL